jgi:hypothetical protein
MKISEVRKRLALIDEALISLPEDADVLSVNPTPPGRKLPEVLLREETFRRAFAGHVITRERQREGDKLVLCNEKCAFYAFAPSDNPTPIVSEEILPAYIARPWAFGN